MQCDSDMVARWEASQRFAVKILLELIVLQQKKQNLQMPSLWLEASGALLADTKDDLHLLTRLFVLPTETYLAQYVEPIDVEGIHNAREFAKKQLAIHLQSQFLAQYQNLLDNKPYIYNTKAMGRRSFKNLCLNYLVATQLEKYAELALEQFNTADNMTDAMGALSALNNYAGVQRQQALDKFYQHWQKQPLVVDKWFALQAGSQLPDTLQQVNKVVETSSVFFDESK